MKLVYTRMRVIQPGFFDVLQWWKLVGKLKYKEIAVAATLFLGRPTHNGFQDTVFSRGTYSDTKLQKG